MRIGVGGMIIDQDDFVEHYGTAGMRWGVRKASGTEIREARRQTREVGKTAKGIIKEGKKATTRVQRKQVAERYKKEVFDRIKSKEFKETYRTANTPTKGQLAVNSVLTGGLGYLTMKAFANSQTLNRRHAAEVGISKEILDELRSA